MLYPLPFSMSIESLEVCDSSSLPNILHTGQVMLLPCLSQQLSLVGSSLPAHGQTSFVCWGLARVGPVHLEVSVLQVGGYLLEPKKEDFAYLYPPEVKLAAIHGTLQEANYLSGIPHWTDGSQMANSCLAHDMSCKLPLMIFMFFWMRIRDHCDIGLRSA